MKNKYGRQRAFPNGPMQDFDGYVVKRIVALIPALQSQDAPSTPVMPGQCSGQQMLFDVHPGRTA